MRWWSSREKGLHLRESLETEKFFTFPFFLLPFIFPSWVRATISRMRQSDALNILKAGRNAYLTGAPGSGKTHVLNEYISYLKDRGVGVGITASTGIAATHIGGMTIHSWSGIGIRDFLSDADIETMLEREHVWKRFDKTSVLIIDEVSMVHSRMFDSIERLCRAMKRSDAPFGGMQIILSGDFFQLPPVSREGGTPDFVYTSQAWKNMDIRVCYLTEQFRHGNDPLHGILSEMRGGALSETSLRTLHEQKDKTWKVGITPTRLFSHNIDVDAHNERELDKLPGNPVIFEMKSFGKPNIVSALEKGILAPASLSLKKGASVMFVKNAFDQGYANGTLGTVEDFEGGVPIVRTFSGKTVYAHTAEWQVEENGKVLARAEQVPLRLAWAITVHKSQGMSIDAAEIDLSRAFVPGQGYVALSRLRTLDGLVLTGANETAFAVEPRATELDAHLRRESAKWERVLTRFEKPDMDAMHTDFVKKSGGVTDPSAIRERKKYAGETKKERVPTHKKTEALVSEGLSLKEISKARNLKVETILSHFELIKKDQPDFSFARFALPAKALREIKKAFEGSDSMALAPVHAKLRGAYSYADIRLARLFL